ncbi:vitamin K epoxide reductase family protein [Candidatus Berkelbacteria bacterium]|nr:vitamin K epoxide reductase family protein [Candidatus Berkelbacteria bacterium]
MDNIIAYLLVFAGIGIANTLYLSYNTIFKKEVACLFFPPEWCKKVQHSPQSKTLGIPNTLAGLGMYITIFALLILTKAGTIPFWPVAAIVTFGFAFSMYFTYVQAYILKAFCTWCVLSAIDFVVMFSIILWNYNLIFN